MAILLMTQGDPAAKEMLRRAIAARYYNSPPTLESLKVEYHGRGHLKLGPIHSWVPLDIRIYFRFPDAMRWDYRLSPFGLPLQRGTGSYVRDTFYSEHGTARITNSSLLDHLRLCIWGAGATMLTPLSQPNIHVKVKTERSFIAVNTVTHDCIEVRLNPDYSLDSVCFSSVNIEDENTQQIAIQPSTDLVALNGVLMPRMIRLLRNNQVAYEAGAVALDCNPPLETSFFMPGYAAV